MRSELKTSVIKITFNCLSNQFHFFKTWTKIYQYHLSQIISIMHSIIKYFTVFVKFIELIYFTIVFSIVLLSYEHYYISYILGLSCSLSFLIYIFP